MARREWYAGWESDGVTTVTLRLRGAEATSSLRSHDHRQDTMGAIGEAGIWRLLQQLRSRRVCCPATGAAPACLGPPLCPFPCWAMEERVTTHSQAPHGPNTVRAGRRPLTSDQGWARTLSACHSASLSGGASELRTVRCARAASEPSHSALRPSSGGLKAPRERGSGHHPSLSIRNAARSALCARCAVTLAPQARWAGTTLCISSAHKLNLLITAFATVLSARRPDSCCEAVDGRTPREASGVLIQQQTAVPSSPSPISATRFVLCPLPSRHPLCHVLASLHCLRPLRLDVVAHPSVHALPLGLRLQ